MVSSGLKGILPLSVRELGYEAKQMFRAFRGEHIAIHSWFVEPTDLCNARCTFCTYPLKRPSGKRVSMDNLRIFFEMAKAAGIRHINFTPLTGDVLNDPEIFEKVRLAKSTIPDAEELSFYTNLIAMSKFQTKEFFESGLTDMSVSMGGFDEETYNAAFGVDAFDLVTHNLTQLVEFKKQFESNLLITVGLRLVKRGYNYTRTSFYVEKVKGWLEKGLVQIQELRNFDSLGGAIVRKDVPIRAEPKLKSLRKFLPCASLENVALLPDGNLRLCNCIASDPFKAQNDDFLIGPLATMSGERVAEAIEAKKRAWRKGSLPDPCRLCTLYSPKRLES